jgi:hypothetical protein
MNQVFGPAPAGVLEFVRPQHSQGSKRRWVVDGRTTAERLLS